MSKTSHIHPIFEQLLTREQKEQRLKQHAKVLWFTGLSGSGKSTIAAGLEKRLWDDGFFVEVLDGDNIRTGISSNLGFSDEDRTENIRRIAQVSKLFLQSGIITLNSFVSPTRSIRQMAKEIIGSNDFIEIFINTPLEICEQRDVKGLYQKARAGEIKNFTGLDAPFETPLNPAIEIKTQNQTVEESVEEVYNQIKKIISYNE